MLQPKIQKVCCFVMRHAAIKNSKALLRGKYLRCNQKLPPLVPLTKRYFYHTKHATMPPTNLSDTIVALATPSGVGAIGVIRLSGPEAIAIADAVFPSKKLAEQPTHTLHYGTIRNDAGRVLDEVVVSLFVGPKSYTGEDVVEISCHGSNYILQEVIQLLIEKGARMAEPGEFTLRAFLNGRMDLSQAEAVADLIASSSASSHKLAMQQMRGGFSSEIQALRQKLIDFASLIELELDFGEEDVEFANRDDLRELVHKLRGLLQQLMDSFRLGNAIKNGVNTVIAGRPNAGKSTLLNALLNEERAIVSDIAGTTRDVIEEVLNIKGVQFRVIDTAGIREAEDTIEAMGVERTLEKVRQSSVLIYLFDVVAMQPEEVHADLQRLYQPGLHILVVANKMDMNPYTKREHFLELGSRNSEFGIRKSEFGSGKSEFGSGKSEFGDGKSEFGDGKSEVGNGNSEVGGEENTSESPIPIAQFEWVPVSAINKMNIPHLKEKLYEAVISDKVSLDETIVTNARHFQALQRADQSLADVLKGMDQSVTSDFIAMDIRQALHHLGEITGEISTDDLLGNIFANFCIGK